MHRPTHTNTHVHTQTCIYTNTPVRIQTCMGHACVLTCTHKHACTQTCTTNMHKLHTCTWTHLHTHSHPHPLHTNMHVPAHTCTDLRVHMHMHRPVHIHVHTHSRGHAGCLHLLTASALDFSRSGFVCRFPFSSSFSSPPAPSALRNSLSPLHLLLSPRSSRPSRGGELGRSSL